MSEHCVNLNWQRQSEDFTVQTYNRSHDWDFGHGVTVPASAAVAYRGDEERVDPEQAFTASLASCHMLTFLAIAAQKGFIVESYQDQAVGVLAKNASGKMAITQVKLCPQIQFRADKQPSGEELADLHKLAHEHCFLANSVSTEVVIK